MRATIRFILNLVMILGAAGAIAWVTTLKAYHHASHDMQIAMVIAPAVAAFAVAWVVMNATKAPKPAPRRASPYATAARRR